MARTGRNLLMDILRPDYLFTKRLKQCWIGEGIESIYIQLPIVHSTFFTDIAKSR